MPRLSDGRDGGHWQRGRRLLVGGWIGKKSIELGDRISPDDLARAMSEVLG
jgi:hypothetical protein